MAKKAATKKERRTGYRKPKNFLKAWDSRDWTKPLTTRLNVAMVDEELPFGKEGGRKSWYLALTQPNSVAQTLGSVRGLDPKLAAVVLFEDDVVALLKHVLDLRLVVLDPERDRVLNGQKLEWTESSRLRREVSVLRHRARATGR